MFDRILKLRRADSDDCRLLWVWVNDPATRAVSFSTQPIPLEEHARWFAAKLADSCCFFFVAEDDEGTPVGQARFDADGDAAIISISVDSRFRGSGYGSELIRLASRELFREADVKLIHAYVKPDNSASARAFEKAHYRSAGTTTVAGHEALDFIMRRDELL